MARAAAEMWLLGFAFPFLDYKDEGFVGAHTAGSLGKVPEGLPRTARPTRA